MSHTVKSFANDPMPPGRLAMSLFLASESMFFIGLVGALFVLGGGASHVLFSRMASVPGKIEGILGALLLVAASAAVWTGRTPTRRITIGRITTRRVIIAIGIAVLFMIVQAVAWSILLGHHTIVATVDAQPAVYDGRVKALPAAKAENAKVELTGISLPLPVHFNASQLTIDDLQTAGKIRGTFTIPAKSVLQDLSFGPWRNNYFACYFLITGVHFVHILVGVIAMTWVAVRMGNNRATDNQIKIVNLYWHYVNGVGVVGLFLLYFV